MTVPARSWLPARLDEVRLALMLLTRLPVGRLGAPRPLSSAIWAYPLAGALVGGLTGATLHLALRAGLPPLPAALLALAVSVLLTGAMHEDGLADVADGFGGGATRERKLEIMRDSRIGSYGVVALVLALGLRAAFLSELPEAGGTAHLAGLSALSRGLLPGLILTLPPARAGGLGQSAGANARPAQVLAGLGLAGAIGLATLPCFLSIAAIMTLATAGIGLLAWRQIGGFTGDVLGAAQITAEVAGLGGLSCC
ncbi:MAG TPA: adenosylcobinamide-GDP ribazoletransferase [Acidocella sp.]|nr:adenosylcobinamide-GDP ribazoletransferase [Acidocella sp.]